MIVETWALPKTPKQQKAEAAQSKDEEEGRRPAWDRGYQ
jgi:hypothetical protein